MKTIIYTFAAFGTMAALSQFAAPLRADDKATARAALVGSWVQNGGVAVWIIDSRADGLHVTQIEGSGPIADFECNTYGHNCEVKIAATKRPRPCITTARPLSSWKRKAIRSSSAASRCFHRAMP
jgi:hypothetical protein